MFSFSSLTLPLLPLPVYSFVIMTSSLAGGLLSESTVLPGSTFRFLPPFSVKHYIAQEGTYHDVR